MPEQTHTMNGLDTSDATLLMCALLLNRAGCEMNPFLGHSVKISAVQPVEDAVRKVYRDMTCSRQETETATFKISRT